MGEVVAAVIGFIILKLANRPLDKVFPSDAPDFALDHCHVAWLGMVACYVAHFLTVLVS